MALCGCSDFLDTRMDVFETRDRLETRYSTLTSFANAYYAPMQYGFETIDGNLFAAASDEAVQTAPVSDVSYFNREELFSILCIVYEEVSCPDTFIIILVKV